MKVRMIDLSKEVEGLVWHKINIWKDRIKTKVIKSLKAGKIVEVIKEYGSDYFIKCGWIKRGYVSKNLTEKIDG